MKKEKGATMIFKRRKENTDAKPKKNICKENQREIDLQLTLLSSMPACGSCCRENFLPKEWVWACGCCVLGCRGGYWAFGEAGVAGVDVEFLGGGRDRLSSRMDCGKPARMSSFLTKRKTEDIFYISLSFSSLR